MQVLSIEADTEQVVPAMLAIEGTAERVNAMRAILFTGRRFVSAIQLAAAPVAAAQQRAPQSSSGAAPAAAAQADASSDTPADTTSTAAASTFSAVLRAQAPAQLSVPDLVDLTKACKYYMSDKLLELIASTGYLRSMLDALPIAEVRGLPVHVDACVLL
jgi:hypothetical protein